MKVSGTRQLQSMLMRLQKQAECVREKLEEKRDQIDENEERYGADRYDEWMEYLDTIENVVDEICEIEAAELEEQ
jgi:cyclopropane fatty-acyl-phospholipid synthase-like methyltransferase